MKKLIERRPFTVRWLDEHPKLKKTDSRSLHIYPNAYVSVEGLSDMFIIVDEDFRIDVAGAKLGERQKEYLSVHYYDISAKLMELYGMSSDEIEVYLKKLKAERNLDVEDFLREFKPKYKTLLYKFSTFVKQNHLALWYYHHDEDKYPKKILEDSWEKFYTWDSWSLDSFGLLDPEVYLRMIDKIDAVDLKEWTEFVHHYTGRDKWHTKFDLATLDEAFEEFESSLGKVEDSIENKLAENFANELKSLQKEGLFENIKSFDLDFTGKGINIKLNEGSYPGDRKDKPVVYTNDEANIIDRFDYKYLEKVIDSLGGTKEFTHGKSETEKPHNTKVYYIGGRSDDHKQLFSDDIISYWTIPLTIKNIKIHIEVAVGYDEYNRLSALVGIDNYHGLIEPSIKRILTSIGFKPAISTKSISDEYSDTFDKHYSVSYDKSFTDTAPINALFKSGSIAKVANILRDLKQKLKLINRNWNNNFVKNEEEYYAQKGLIPGRNEYKVLVDSDNNTIITSEGDSLIKEDLHIFLKDLQKDNKNKNIDWEYLFDWLKDNAYEDNVFEGLIKEMKNQGFDNIEDLIKIEVRGLNGARKNRLKSIEKNAKRDAAHRYESFKKFSNLKENESSEVTYMQDFSIEDYYNDIDEVEAAASELGISISFDDNEIYATASSEEVLKQFLYDWDLIENDDDFEAGLL